MRARCRVEVGYHGGLQDDAPFICKRDSTPGALVRRGIQHTFCSRSCRFEYEFDDIKVAEATRPLQKFEWTTEERIYLSLVNVARIKLKLKV